MPGAKNLCVANGQQIHALSNKRMANHTRHNNTRAQLFLPRAPLHFCRCFLPSLLFPTASCGCFFASSIRSCSIFFALCSARAQIRLCAARILCSLWQQATHINLPFTRAKWSGGVSSWPHQYQRSQIIGRQIRQCPQVVAMATLKQATFGKVSE